MSLKIASKCFQLKYVNVTYRSNSDIYVKYKEDTLKKVLPILKEIGK